MVVQISPSSCRRYDRRLRVDVGDQGEAPPGGHSQASSQAPHPGKEDNIPACGWAGRRIESESTAGGGAGVYGEVDLNAEPLDTDVQLNVDEGAARVSAATTPGKAQAEYTPGQAAVQRNRRPRSRRRRRPPPGRRNPHTTTRSRRRRTRRRGPQGAERTQERPSDPLGSRTWSMLGGCVAVVSPMVGLAC